LKTSAGAKPREKILLVQKKKKITEKRRGGGGLEKKRLINLTCSQQMRGPKQAAQKENGKKKFWALTKTEGMRKSELEGNNPPSGVLRT